MTETGQIILPPAKVLRKMGLFEDQDGIFYRYSYEKEAWDEHLRNTREFIQKGVCVNSKSTIALLGSGWLLDVPMDFLINEFAEVHCYDLRHPTRIREKYQSNPKVKFIEMDLTGGMIERAYQLCSRWRKANSVRLLRELDVPTFSLHFSAQQVVSVNLLNQLDILIMDYVRKFYKLTTHDASILRQRIQQGHINLLSGYRALLITDYEELHLSDNDEELNRSRSIHCNIPESDSRQGWTWKFDTHKTYNPNWKTYLNVLAQKL